MTRRRTALFSILPLLIAFGAYQWWYRATTPPLTGDEPQYLVMAHSLAHDGDLDLADDYRTFGAAQIAPGTLAFTGQAGDYRHDGTLRSVHAPGLGFLLAPVGGRADPTSAGRNVMVLVAALLAWQLFGLLRDLFPGRTAACAAAWAATALSLPLLGYADQFYPEVPAALLLVTGVRLLLPRRGLPAWAPAGVLASALAALTPWLHVRFGLFAAAVALAAMVVHRRRGIAVMALCAAPFAVSVLVLGWCFQRWYGSPLPSAPYTPEVIGIPAQSLTQSYRVGIGSWLSPTSGAVPFSPFLLVGFVGIPAAVRRFGRAGWAALAVAAAYALVVVPLGPFAYFLPGRYVVVLVPFLAVGAAAVLVSAPWTWPVAAVGAVASAAVVVGTVGAYGSLLDSGTVTALRSTAFMWPSTTSDQGFAQLVTSPLSAAPGGGVQTPGTSVRSAVPYAVSVTVAGECPPAPAGGPAARIEVVRPDDPRVPPLASAEAPCGQPTSLPFRAPAVVPVAVRITPLAPGSDVHPAAIEGGLVDPGRDRPRSIWSQAWKALAWIVAVAALAVAVLRSQEHPARA